jgi:tetratricopeptide (TPR) repeat protein
LFRGLYGADPSPAELNNIGAALQALDSVEAALRHYRLAVERDSTYADGWYNLAKVLERLGDSERALACLQRVRELEGPGYELDLAIARLLVRLGRERKALEYYSSAVQRAGDDRELLLEAADTAWRAGDRGTAQELYGRYGSLSDSSRIPARVKRRLQ